MEVQITLSCANLVFSKYIPRCRVIWQVYFRFLRNLHITFRYSCTSWLFHPILLGYLFLHMFLRISYLLIVVWQTLPLDKVKPRCGFFFQFSDENWPCVYFTSICCGNSWSFPVFLPLATTNAHSCGHLYLTLWKKYLFTTLAHLLEGLFHCNWDSWVSDIFWILFLGQINSLKIFCPILAVFSLCWAFLLWCKNV